MTPLLCDYRTKKKSITVTAWATTFLLAFVVIVLTVVGHINGGWVIPVPLVLTVIGYNLSYMALYWNKRVRASTDGLEISNEENK